MEMYDKGNKNIITRFSMNYYRRSLGSMHACVVAWCSLISTKVESSKSSGSCKSLRVSIIKSNFYVQNGWPVLSEFMEGFSQWYVYKKIEYDKIPYSSHG